MTDVSGPIHRGFLIAASTLALFAGAPAFGQEVVLIPNRVIYPGETVEMSALREVTLKPSKVVPDGTAFNADELEGKVARRTLLPGA